MKKVKLRWVFWLSVERYKTNYYHKTRGANYFEFVKCGFKFSIGMPWAVPFVRYHTLNKYGKQTEGIEKTNDEMMKAPGFKMMMPKKTYLIN